MYFAILELDFGCLLLIGFFVDHCFHGPVPNSILFISTQLAVAVPNMASLKPEGTPSPGVQPANSLFTAPDPSPMNELNFPCCLLKSGAKELIFFCIIGSLEGGILSVSNFWPSSTSVPALGPHG
eukprot:EG_transcript_30259